MRSKLATDWNKDSSMVSTFKKLFDSNPGYTGKMHKITEWLVEFDSDGMPSREIGLGEESQIVVAGPNNRDYGFWLDTNMKKSDFRGKALNKSEFEDYWTKADVDQ